MSEGSAVRVRYQGVGHLRVQIPTGLCQEDPTREALIRGLHRIEGVYRVDVYARDGKLSIRYLDPIVSPSDIVAAIDALIEHRPSAPCPVAPDGSQAGPGSIRPAAWARGKLREIRETLLAFRILLGRTAASRGGSGSLAAGLLRVAATDAAIAFLVRSLWKPVFSQWVRRPWRHRYQWIAVAALAYRGWRRRSPGSRTS
ncbi:MAG: heavy metal-associated domain-containing protein [Methylotetracoccus sp.]